MLCRESIAQYLLNSNVQLINCTCACACLQKLRTIKCFEQYRLWQVFLTAAGSFGVRGVWGWQEPGRGEDWGLQETSPSSYKSIFVRYLTRSRLRCIIWRAYTAGVSLLHWHSFMFALLCSLARGNPDYYTKQHEVPSHFLLFLASFMCPFFSNELRVWDTGRTPRVSAMRIEIN